MRGPLTVVRNFPPAREQCQHATVCAVGGARSGISDAPIVAPGVLTLRAPALSQTPLRRGKKE